jgi:hypothetical protein
MRDPMNTLTSDDDALLHSASRLGKEVWIRTDAGTPGLSGVVEDEVHLDAGDVKHAIQRIRLADGGTYGYSTGSFVLDAGTGRVRWRPGALVISERDYRELLAKARARGWPL